MQNHNQVSVRQLALNILQVIYLQQAYANIALSKAIANTQLSSLDRKFLTELVYGTVKTAGTLDWILQSFISRPLHKIPPMILYILRMSLYQIFYMDKTPDSAACNEGVNLSKKYAHSGTVKFVNGVLRNIIRNKDSISFPDITTQPIQHIALKYHHPEWLINDWIKKLGIEDTIALCMANNQTPKLTARTNTLKTSRAELLQLLTSEGINTTPSPYSLDGFIITDMQAALDSSKSFKNGLWQIQDESSMLATEILNPLSNTFVIDMCAAPGGKTTHIAQKMNNRGTILAFDIYDHKLSLINDNATRLGISIIKAQQQNAEIIIPDLIEKADYVLVDAPCSGLGVLRRRADARWRKTPEDLAQFAVLQSKIIDNAAQYVKPGGYIVYSTCTIRQEENSDIINLFLQKHTNFTREDITHPLTQQVLPELSLYPHIDHTDGFYIAKLRKKQ